MTLQAFVNAYIVTIVTRYLVPIVIALTFIVFLYGLLTFLVSSDDPKKHSDAAKYMLRGLIGLTIALSIWAIVSVGASLFGSAPVIPQLR
jgi:hypothetical protein